MGGVGMGRVGHGRVGEGKHGWGAYMYAWMHGSVREWNWRSRTDLNKVIVDPCPVGQEEAAARGQAVKEEELLLSA